jgi:hypothetical protein
MTAAAHYKRSVVDKEISKDRNDNIKRIFNQGKEMRVSANQDIIITLKNLNQEQEEHRQFQERIRRIKEMSKRKLNSSPERTREDTKRSRTAQGNYSRLERAEDMGSSQPSRGQSRMKKDYMDIKNQG